VDASESDLEGRGLEPVGVIPGGGGATRLAPLPFSKELLPIGFRQTPLGPRPKVIANYLLDALRGAGARRVYWLLDKRKSDVLGYFGSGAEFGVRIGFVPTDASPSVVHTLDAAHEFLRGQYVLFGFPDIIFEPHDAPARLWERLGRRQLDVVLGAVPAPAGVIADRVEVGAEGKLLKVRVKPLDRAEDPAWILAAWSPRFTGFLHAWLAKSDRERVLAGNELYLGHAIEAARQAGLSVEVETFPGGCFIDAGTPEGLGLAIERYGAIGDIPLEGP
jgi:glucose-1-phosphate thymidylyltransferase